MPEPILDPGEAPPRRAVLLVNGKSRRGDEFFREARDRLTELGIELADAKCESGMDHLKVSVQRAVESGIPMVIAGGGDGTFSSIARYFVDAETTLGVLPMGTGNAFARDLGIAVDLNAACATIHGGRVARVDLGQVNGDYFLNVATIGLTTRIALALTDPMKRRFGRFVYVVALAQALVRVQPFHVRLETDLGTSEFETLLFVMGNGRYHAGPFLLSPTASIVDGRLTVYALATTRKSAFLKFALALVTGHQGNLPEVRTESPTSGRITTTPQRRVTVDGEVSTQTPIRFNASPRALRVVVPQTFDDRR